MNPKFFYSFIFVSHYSRNEWQCAGIIICLELGADLHVAQMMPVPLTVSCFSKIQIGFTFLVLAHPGLGSPGKRAVKRVCVCVLADRVVLDKGLLKVCVYSYNFELNFLTAYYPFIFSQ